MKFFRGTIIAVLFPTATLSKPMTGGDLVAYTDDIPLQKDTLLSSSSESPSASPSS
eukprot:CAMPEP_0170998888 /NCGR_PEP_ID=MMETSP0736-20130129/13740_1 /TAXON_ID=186038 /ORGANISM="Fragilariopsis kerguelensis, Strain L26-C5" /LENGTH=55 /DNA_ID=CAMNT_0011425889 /DNA_START=72 /DNA_END=235 /DNA_ORIENTATION=+